MGQWVHFLRWKESFAPSRWSVNVPWVENVSSPGLEKQLPSFFCHFLYLLSHTWWVVCLNVHHLCEAECGQGQMLSDSPKGKMASNAAHSAYTCLALSLRKCKCKWLMGTGSNKTLWKNCWWLTGDMVVGEPWHVHDVKYVSPSLSV